MKNDRKVFVSVWGGVGWGYKDEIRSGEANANQSSVVNLSGFLLPHVDLMKKSL